MLKQLIDAQLQISPEKTMLFARQVVLLGQRMSHGLAKPNLNKTKAIWKHPMPKSKKEIKAFLSLSACKDVELQWGDEQ